MSISSAARACSKARSVRCAASRRQRRRVGWRGSGASAGVRSVAHRRQVGAAEERAVTPHRHDQVRGRWVTAQKKRINVSQTRFATTVRPKTPGLYRVSIVADGVTRRRTLRALR